MDKDKIRRLCTMGTVGARSMIRLVELLLGTQEMLRQSGGHLTYEQLETVLKSTITGFESFETILTEISQSLPE